MCNILPSVHLHADFLRQEQQEQPTFPFLRHFQVERSAALLNVLEEGP